MLKRIILGTSSILISLVMTAAPVAANHPWGNFHWARTANPLVLQLGDNLTTNWDSYLATASNNWSQSAVLDTAVAAGRSGARRCNPVSGRVELCNYRYGSNGWLGVASIWTNGDHIVQGTVKMNDTYFNTAKYNTPAWRNLVLCQELGHTFGLDHQDEVFDNSPLGTCMDYTNDPTLNQQPNAHDYDQLAAIYGGHLDSVNTAAPASAALAPQDSTPGDWGRLVKSKGRTAIYERDLGRGKKVFTFVIQAY